MPPLLVPSSGSDYLSADPVRVRSILIRLLDPYLLKFS